MDVYLPRCFGNDKQTIGTLVTKKDTGEIFSAKTLELPWLNNQRRISCIPAPLRVFCTFELMVNHNVKHYLLHDVPGRDGIFIHAGVVHEDFLGCIGLSYSLKNIAGDAEPDLTSSMKAVQDFERFMNYQPFYLNIFPA